MQDLSPAARKIAAAEIRAAVERIKRDGYAPTAERVAFITGYRLDICRDIIVNDLGLSS